MSPHALAEYARDIAFITFSLIEAIDQYDERKLPQGYRYHLFGGFMGFCDHAASAAHILATTFAGMALDDGWIEIVDDYARLVIARAVQFGSPASPRELTRLAQRAKATLSTHTAPGAPA